METITLTREELLEFAKMATFHLDDRLVPFSRENLRAEAFVIGYLFAKRYQKKREEEEVNIAPKPGSDDVFMRGYKCGSEDASKKIIDLAENHVLNAPKELLSEGYMRGMTELLNEIKNDYAQRKQN